MLFVLLFYGFVLLVLATIGIFVFRLLRRWGPGQAVVGTLLVLIFAALLWPIPIHGGVLFLGEVLYDEWLQQKTDAPEENSRVLMPIGQSAGRFVGSLDVTPGARISGGWLEVWYGVDKRALMHEATGLVWSHWLPLSTHALRPTLTVAKDRCTAREPPGYWALATAAEDALAWRDNGNGVIPRPNTSTMSYFIDPHLRMELPTYQLQGGLSVNQQSVKSDVFSIRCVARGASAPANGYSRADVDLQLWNRYQLKGLIAP